jgi:hypothetical protein
LHYTKSAKFIELFMEERVDVDIDEEKRKKRHD